MSTRIRRNAIEKNKQQKAQEKEEAQRRKQESEQANAKTQEHQRQQDGTAVQWAIFLLDIVEMGWAAFLAIHCPKPLPAAFQPDWSPTAERENVLPPFHTEILGGFREALRVFLVEAPKSHSWLLSG